LTRLTVDLGNSLCKLRAWRLPDAPSELPELIGRIDLDTCAETLEEAVRAWVTGLTRDAGEVARAAICSVAAAERTARTAEALIGALGARVPVAVSLDSGLENRCRTPETVGPDRLFAARGALSLVRRACLVVDAGTAVTVDVVLDRGAGSSAGAFLGGAIAPGPELLARSLAEGTAHLPRVEPAVGSPALGRDTNDALLAGVGVGFRGAVRELALRIASEAEVFAGGSPPTVVLTGGARAHLLEPESVFAGEVVVHGHLVHLGLLAALG
jgi:type III pantothenate kinase